MKYFFVLLTFIIPSFMQACPTCVARVTKDSPPFFADDFYQKTPQSQQKINPPANKQVCKEKSCKKNKS